MSSSAKSLGPRAWARSPGPMASCPGKLCGISSAVEPSRGDLEKSTLNKVNSNSLRKLCSCGLYESGAQPRPDGDGPPEPASPPRPHPALAYHRGDALRILAAARVAEPDHPAPLDLALRCRRARDARDRCPMEDRMAEHPPPRRRVRDHRGRPRGQVVLRPGLDGPRDARVVRSMAR